MKIALIILIVLAVVAVGCGMKISSTYNQLVAERNTIERNWHDVDVMLERRADLIPNLVETVKGYAQHESGAIQAVANARAALVGARTPADRMSANTQLDGALGRLLVVVENYPNLKADEQFRNLQFELAGAENRIAQERRRYNEAVQRFNTDLELFPNNLFAGMLGFSKHSSYFTAEAGAREVPKVKF
ncbi:MAG: LemA family protein [Bryobacteraceae bacterium]|jgi:LemA protein